MRRLLAAVLCLALAAPGAFAKSHHTKKSTSTKAKSKGIPCSDGTTSHAKHTQGACSHHGGIKK